MSGNVVKMADSAWRKMLTYTAEAKVRKDPGNALIMLTHGKWRGCLAYDEFSDRTYWAKAPPELNADIIKSPRAGAEVSDRDAIYVGHWFSIEEGVNFARDTMLSAIDSAAHANVVCPPREYLKGITWDKVPRLASMFVDYFGAEPSEYGTSIGTWWMISAVARIFDPGEKADCILILQGAQGAKKSTALHVLGGDWYSNSLPDVTSKDAPLSLFGSWIIELPELEAMHRSTETAFKDFSARTFDKFRPPYGRFQITRKRMCVFAGTTNNEKILKDETGARRFWPQRVGITGQIDIAGLRRDRNQLWAEAVSLFMSGAQWWPTSEMQTQITAEQDERFAEDVWAMPVAKWIEDLEATGAEDFTTYEIMQRALNVDVARMDHLSATRVGKIIRRLGYEARGRRSVGARKFSVYVTRRAVLQLRLQRTREPGED